MWRLVLRLLVVLVAVAAVTGAGLYFFLRQSLPDVNGTIALQGLSAPVEIVRDAIAVPHIAARTKNDALFGLGYVHAQDRLWQMEFQRRIGHGRLSEIFGAAAIPQDRFLRTVGFGRAARSAWERLDQDTRTQVDAYLAGVNAFIATHRGRRLPPEFSLLRIAPEPFTGPDVLVWVKMMSWDLSANYSFELMRRDLSTRVGDERMAELLPPYPADGLTIVKQAAAPAGHAPAAPSHVSRHRTTDEPTALFSALNSAFARGVPSVRDFLQAAHVEGLGSNNWVVDGTMTASGKPLLANDPHLSTKIPSLWYLAHLSWETNEMAGATLPGVPAVAIGRNRDIAWGETNVGADVEDLYRERLDPEGARAEFKGVWEPMQRIKETILVSGGDPVDVDVRITRHGPLISDAINANNRESASAIKPAELEPLAFRWVSLDESDDTLTAFVRLNDARNWTEFTNALRLYHAPSQNFVYADTEGHIGYYAPGHIPVRASGDGSQPVDGWSGDAEWDGWVPFEELPHLFDPPDHFIVTANHRPLAADTPHIALEFYEPYRAQRITELLENRRGLTPTDFKAVQADVLSPHARTLLPKLLPLLHVTSPRSQQAADLLAKWDFTATGDSAAAAIFQAWFLRLAPAIVGDELGQTVLEGYRGRFSYISRFVLGLTEGRGTAWCNDVTTDGTETCEQSVTKAFEEGVADLANRLGSNVGAWRWSAVHDAVFPHQGLDAVAPLRWLLSRRIPNGGDWSTVNVGTAAANALYDQVSIPGYRQVIDLSPANDSYYQDAVGQSGHFLSRYYDEALEDWQAVRLRGMRMKPEEYGAGSLGRLVLTP